MNKVVLNAREQRVRPAGFITRLIAFLVDIVILSLTVTLVVFFIQQIITFFGIDTLLNKWNITTSTSDYLPTILRYLAIILTYLFSILYFSFFWFLTGYTPGKNLLGLKVIRTNGKKLTFWRCLLRAFCYYLSGLVFFLGFIWIILDRNRQGWHDKIVGTLVIYT
jgi:uncharacterized RDD family membrane protein YckC